MLVAFDSDPDRSLSKQQSERGRQELWILVSEATVIAHLDLVRHISGSRLSVYG